MGSTPQELFEEIVGHFDAEKWGTEDAILAFEIAGENGGSWVATVKDGQASLDEGTVDNADMTMVADSTDLMAMVSGDLEPGKRIYVRESENQGEYVACNETSDLDNWLI